MACSFDGSGLVSAGPPSSTATTTGESSTTATDPGATVGPTTAGPDGTVGNSDSDDTNTSTSTTTPVDPTSSTTTTSTTEPPLTTEPDTSTTEPDTTTTGPDTTTSSTTEPDTTTSTGPDTTTGPMCMDTGAEPYDSEGQAFDLGEQHCKDDPKSFQGVLDGGDDDDWYRYYGDFSGNSCNQDDPDPTAKIVVTADGPLEVCLYADCDIDGATGFTCPGGTMMANSPANRAGCCGTGSMEYVVNCIDGPNESAEMFVHIGGAAADACIEYEIDYSYHN